MINALLSRKTAVVTGCSRGIGKSILEVFAQQGANVYACIRKPEKNIINYIEALAEKNGVDIWPIYFDLSDGEEVKEGAKKIISDNRPIDILVNNAGVVHTALFQMTTVDKMKEVFNVNFFSSFVLTQYVVKAMVRRKSGTIINISSTAAIDGVEGRTAYASSKAAVISTSKVMAKELAHHKIRVNVIAPGLTSTDMMLENTPKKHMIDTLERISMKRPGTPEEIANMALFLASDLSSYVTGQVIRVDGGM